MLLMFVSNIWVYASPNSEKAAKPAGQSFTLVSLKHESSGAMTRIQIESSAPPLYTISRPTEKLLVIDLPGGESTQLTPWYAVKSAAVESVAVRKSHVGSASAANTSRFVGTSIEIALQDNVRDRSKLNGNTLIVELISDKTSATSSAKPGVYVDPVPVAGSASVEPVPVKAKIEPKSAAPAKAEINAAKPAATEPEKIQPSANSLKAATVIRDVRSEALEGAARIVIDTDGTAPFKNFSLESPYRIVVDITGVRSLVGNKTVTVGAASVDKVRLGQPSANVVRVVVDAKAQTPYRVEREGAALVITVGNLSAASKENSNSKSVAQLSAAQTTPPATSQVTPQTTPQVELPPLDARSANAEVKVAGQRIDKQKEPTTVATLTPSQEAKASVKTDAANKTAAQANTTSNKTTAPPTTATPTTRPSVMVTTPTQSAKPAIAENTVAQANKPTPNKPNTETRPRVSNPSSNSAKQPQKPPVREQISQPSTGGRSVSELQRQQPQVQTAPPVAPTQAVLKTKNDQALCDPNYVGGLISFDLRSGVDIRDMLRFVSQQYGINFVVDKSVAQVPVDIRVNDLPWNYVLDSVLRANRLGTVCDKGRIIRVSSLTAIAEEETQQRQILEAQALKVPLVTKIIHLRYARASGSLGGDSGGSSGRSSGASSGASSSGNSRGGLLAIAEKRLSPRGRIEMDPRTNSIVVTDLPEYVEAVEDIMNKLDRPEAQVEIEARIVIASRNFLRDIGVELAAGAASQSGKAGVFATSPVRFTPGTGLSSTTSSGSGSGSGSSGGSSTTNNTNLIGPLANGTLSAAANTVLGLTTGIFGTSIISASLTASETKGQIRTIASPRVTTSDNKTAEIVNGVQIPVQTVSNNTITTTFVTAALRLQITPQIIEENGEVLMKVIAENNTVNFNIANQFNNGTPGINTQSAESTVRVPDGGTTVMGGINIDSEGHTVNRTPGVSRIPVVGELFKRRTNRRDFDEILFFITPRIIRNDNVVKPKAVEPLDGRVTPETPPAKTKKQ
jgi:type IV pilus assembly protein PilQ